MENVGRFKQYNTSQLQLTSLYGECFNYLLPSFSNSILQSQDRQACLQKFSPKPDQMIYRPIPLIGLTPVGPLVFIHPGANLVILSWHITSYSSVGPGPTFYHSLLAALAPTSPSRSLRACHTPIPPLAHRQAVVVPGAQRAPATDSKRYTTHRGVSCSHPEP